MTWVHERDEVKDEPNKAVRVSIVAQAGTLAITEPVDVNVVSGGSSGAQYTEGDVDASITGTAVMWEDTGDTLRSVSAAKPLPVNVVSGGSAGIQYTEGDTDTTITGTAALTEGPSNTLTPLQSNAAKDLVVSLDGESVTVTGSVTADTELTTKDYDSGAGTDTVAVVGILLPKSGGAVAGGTSTDPIRTDPTGTTAQPVSGTVTANQGTPPWSVEGQVAQDSPTTGKPIICGSVASASAPSPVSADGDAVQLWVTRTGILQVGDGNSSLSVDDAAGPISVDDNGGSLTVDGTVSVSGSVDTELPAAAALGDSDSNPTAPQVGACNQTWDTVNSKWAREAALYYQSTAGVGSSATGTAVDMSKSPCLNFTMNVFKSGTVTGVTVNLQGSMDNTNWYILTTYTSAAGSDGTVFASGKPARYFRYTTGAINGGGTETIQILAMRGN